MSTVLADPIKLAQLVADLEGANSEPIHLADCRAVLSRSADDPAMLRLWLVPDRADTVGGEFAAWAQSKLGTLARSKRVDKESVIQITVVAHGSGDRPVQRAPRQRIRRLDATTYLWAEKLGCADARGGIDESLVQELVRRLNSKWDAQDEDQFVMPSILPVPGQPSGANVLEGMRAGRPTLPEGRLIVLYGPGGIGKTFFLRRLSAKLSRFALDNLSWGLPAFCPLPALLYSDALETWLSNRALGRLTLPQIRTLLRAGVVVPLLDALDELVRGQAREGSAQFLRALKAFGTAQSVFVLSCRDYYLNVDPLVPDNLRGEGVEEFAFGYFNEQGRRSFLQAKVDLRPEQAARWSQALEREAADTLGAWTDVDGLIGHPLFMDAFCTYVASLPRNTQAAEASRFRFSQPDVFKQIVDRVLERETAKAIAWKAEFGDRLMPPWNEPFDVGQQRALFLAVVLRVARDGAELTDERTAKDPRYKDISHGLFSFSSAATDLSGLTNLERLASLVELTLGRPVPTPGLSLEKAEEAVGAALSRGAAFFAQHTLANTEPDRPDDLIFALRHRAYFDYLLAEEVTNRLQRAVEAPNAAGRQEFIDWCALHNLFGRYRSAFDFLLWQSRIVTDGVAALQRLGQADSGADDLLLSYVTSLALDLGLRRGAGPESLVFQDFTLAPSPGAELLLIDDILPPTISSFSIRNGQFPRLVLSGISLRDVVVNDSDADELVFEDMMLERCRLEAVDVGSLEIDGSVEWRDCVLDIDVVASPIRAADDARLSIYSCRVSQRLWDMVQSSFVGRSHLLTTKDVDILPPPVAAATPQSKGRRFLSQLMRVVRKDGRDNWGVYFYKLRGMSTATDATMDAALAILFQNDLASRVGNVILLTPKASSAMFDGRGRPGHPAYEQFEDIWDPVARELDSVL